MRRALTLLALALLVGCGGSGGPPDTATQVAMPPVSADDRGNCPVAYPIKAGTYDGRQVYLAESTPGPADSTLVLPSDPSGPAPSTFDQFRRERCFSSSVEARGAGHASLDPLAG